MLHIGFWHSFYSPASEEARLSFLGISPSFLDLGNWTSFWTYLCSVLNVPGAGYWLLFFPRNMVT